MDKRTMLNLGLQLIKIKGNRWRKWKRESKEAKFKEYYGSSCKTVTKIWDELNNTSVDAARLLDKQKIPKYFLMSLYYLTIYPTMSRLADQFDVCKKTAETWVWVYIKKIRALSPKKIVWPTRWDQPGSEELLLSVDGIHFFIYIEDTMTPNRYAGCNTIQTCCGAHISEQLKTDNLVCELF